MDRLALVVLLTQLSSVLTTLVSPPVWWIEEHSGKQYAMLSPDGRLYNQSASKALCESIGGILPEPKNWNELTGFVTTHFPSKEVWLGMNDKDVEGTWVWESDNSSVAWVYWEPWQREDRFMSEPNGGGLENCATVLNDAYIGRYNYEASSWGDRSCDRTVSAVMCEKKHPWTSTDPATGKQYTTMTDRNRDFNHNASKALCASIGGILPEPRSPEENEFVAGLSDEWLWLGMNDTKEENTWVWESENSRVDWTYWESWRLTKQPGDTGEPDGGDRENCAVIIKNLLPSINSTFYNQTAWADIPCNYFAREVVCENEACLTRGCKDAAERISRSLNTSVDPCDDMYEFSCGSSIQRLQNKYPGEYMTQFKAAGLGVNKVVERLLEEPVSAEDHRAIKKIKKLYKSCTDTESMDDTGMKSLLTEFGGWPIITSTWSKENFSLEDTMVKLNSYGINVLLGVTVDVDWKNNTNHVLQIEDTSLALGIHSRYLYLQPRNHSGMTKYQNLIEGVAMLMGGATANETTVRSDAKDIVDFEIELAKIKLSKELSNDFKALYHVQTLAEVHGNYSSAMFDWRRYITRVMTSPSIGVTDITTSEKIINKAPSYYRNLTQLLVDTDKRVLANYLLWRVVDEMFSTLGDEYRNITAYRALWGDARVGRVRYCIHKVTSFAPLAVARLYIEDNFKPEAKTTASEIVEKLRVSFIDILNEQEWMDNQTKLAARSKIDKMTKMVAYPDKIRNNTYLEEVYSNYTYDRDDYFGNFIRFHKENFASNERRLQQPVDKTRWKKNPTSANAHYDFFQNTAEILLGAVLQPPFYKTDYPMYLNYGAMGTVVGHEMTHGFDLNGRRFDSNGNMVNWWSDHALTEYDNKAQCFKEQYGNFTIPQLNVKMDGEHTVGENIGDNGGLKQSFRAYRKWVEDRGTEEAVLPGLNYTQDQLFFISFSQMYCAIYSDRILQIILRDTHTIGRFRVIGPAQNSEEFAKAFNCPRDSYMNPSKKCSLW